MVGDAFFHPKECRDFGGIDEVGMFGVMGVVIVMTMRVII